MSSSIRLCNCAAADKCLLRTRPTEWSANLTNKLALTRRQQRRRRKSKIRQSRACSPVHVPTDGQLTIKTNRHRTRHNSVHANRPHSFASVSSTPPPALYSSCPTHPYPGRDRSSTVQSAAASAETDAKRGHRTGFTESAPRKARTREAARAR